ncbi:hypothetical protein SpCBS45565_g00649 [Spizellomyces sp. 'palustris']|nr:hypothetical protein SpCBS45565_g00649 [Spizellomyces sp. 'palustris']
MPGPRYSKDHLALRQAIEVARCLPYDPAGDWTIVAWDKSNGIITDANGFIRASFSYSRSFTPEILLDLLLQACHTHISTARSPYLCPYRPRTLGFLSSTSVPDGSIEIFADLLKELRLGIEVAPVWEEDRRVAAYQLEGRLQKGWWGTADPNEEAVWRDDLEREKALQKARREERGCLKMLWTVLMLFPFVSFIATRLRLIANGSGNAVTY